MSRKLREWYPGAIYHITQRGIRRKKIFKHEKDYAVFLSDILKTLKRYECKLHAYCLMPNHYHLLLETNKCEVWKFMKELAHDYAQYFNCDNNYKGHLFEGRYVSCLVKDDSYFLTTSKYIHLNPVKAKISVHPEEYLWSSYRGMIGMKDDRLIDKEKTLSYFSNNKVYKYREFVEDYNNKYIIDDKNISKIIREEETWLPW